MDTKINILFITIIACLSFTSCDYEDNYEGPNANFHGKLINKITGESYYSEQPNGFLIRFKEISWGADAQAQTFYGMYDGSFNWDHLFGYTGGKYEGSQYNVATYEVEPYDGAFIVVEPKKKVIEVKAGDKAEVNFEVIPYISLTEEHMLDGNTLTVKYTMKREVENNKSYTHSGVIISSKTRYLSGNLNGGGFEKEYSKFKSSSDLQSYNDGDIIQETVKLTPGKTYWLRVGAKRDGTDRWNYTQVIEIKVAN
ncbi:DUF3823 domain-containing protein [Dysgonomonas sp.]